MPYTTRVQVRVTPLERDLVHAAALALGVSDSQFVRDALAAESRRVLAGAPEPSFPRNVNAPGATAVGDDAGFDALLAGSSFGSPQALAIRAAGYEALAAARGGEDRAFHEAQRTRTRRGADRDGAAP